MHRLSIVLLAATLLSGSASAAVIHVDADAGPGGDGTSWSQAFASLNDAVAAAQDGDELWVAAGTYVPSATSFVLDVNLALYGGFAGTESRRDERDWIANPTILSGDVNGDDGPDFTNRDDNVGSVLTLQNLADVVSMSGFTIKGGEAVLGGGIEATGADLVVHACQLTANRASARGGAIHCDGGSLHVTDSTFEANRADGSGGCAINAEVGAAVTVEGCTFERNEGAVGGGMRLLDAGPLEVRDSMFIRQTCVAGGGAFILSNDVANFDRCTFIGNQTFAGGGALWGSAATSTISHCTFIQNDAGSDKGGGVAVGAGTTIVNCAFSQNRAAAGGGIYAGGATTVINCSLSGNVGGAIGSGGSKDPFVVQNSVLWGNFPEAFTAFPQGSLPDENAIVSDSIVQGGHPGSGVLDADPLFRQPGLDDLRLTAGSPAIDAGENAHLPKGFDEFDLDGAPRIQGGTVDMGAYEGVADGPLPPAASHLAIDQGEPISLAPLATEPGFAPIELAGVILLNVSGGDGQAATLIQRDDDPHPGAGGYRLLTDALEFETSIEPGAFVARVSLPFDADDLGGVDPLEMDVTVWDAANDTWALAVSANVGDSSPIGERHAVESVTEPVIGFVVGDYGVYWNPVELRGYAWAHVNHTSDFGAGIPRCRADAAQPPDGLIGWLDLTAVLAAWGGGPGPFDVDFDGIVGMNDLVALLQAWGTCDD